VLADVRRGRYVRPSRSTVGEYLLETWLPARRVNLRASTVVGYEKVIRRRILPHIGDELLASLDAATLEHFYARLLSVGGEGGRPLSPKTVANTAGVLSIALADAVRLKIVPHNVTSDARLPSRHRPEMNAWTEEEAGAFLASVADDRLFPIWRLTLATGLRRGSWRDSAGGTSTLPRARSRSRALAWSPTSWSRVSRRHAPAPGSCPSIGTR
jgi:integrase